MTPKEREVMQQALEALIEVSVTGYPTTWCNALDEEITALREALAKQSSCKKPDFAGSSCSECNEKCFPIAEQAEQEPVAKEVLKDCAYFNDIDFEQTPPYLRYDTGDSTAKENWDEYCTIQECLREYGYELTDSDVDHDTVCGDVTRVVEQAEQEPECKYKEAYIIWQDKTEWVQETAQPKELGMHRADALRQRIENLQNAAPVRTKDLTDDEIAAIAKERATVHGKPEGIAHDFARAVIAADREKNK